MFFMMIAELYCHIAGKKNGMKKTAIILIGLLCAAVSCDPLMHGERRGDLGGGNARRQSGDSVGLNHIFVTGVDFPEGYDWRRDTA